MDVVTLAAEFPNDNPALHRGVIWVCRDVTGAPEAERVLAEVSPLADVEAAPPTQRDEVLDDVIVVEELEPVEAHLEGGSDACAHLEGDSDACAREDEAMPVAAPRVSEVMLVGTRVAFEDEPPPLSLDLRESEQAREVRADDPFAVLVDKVAEVAMAAGAIELAAVIPELLESGVVTSRLGQTALDALVKAGLWTGSEISPSFLTVARAWREILRGTSDDFDACGGATLDEWASELLAKLLGDAAKAPLLRQELRSRGVAAFGLAA